MSAANHSDSLRWHRIQEVFHGALALPAPERLVYIRLMCCDDEVLFTDVTAMLEEDARGDSLLDCNLPDVAASLLASLRRSFEREDFRQYRLEKQIGEGGAGTVYLAQRIDLASTVAIKILSSGALSAARRQRFADEQRTLAQLDHPFIARIFDADMLPDGTPWFAMEYVEGRSITAFVQSRNCSITERLRIFRTVCEAVQYAHGRAIIHLDLKPSNILVKADGTVKLVDFGIARQVPDERANPTRTASWAMTPAYASPEQLRGEPLGIQTDIYSLGVVLYELLTGTLPFDLKNKTPAEIERRVLEDEVTPPSVAARRPEASNPSKPGSCIGKSAWADLDVLCLTAVHRDLRRRYASAEALIRDLDHYFKGEPLEARPDSFHYRLRKFVGRNLRILSVTATMLAIITGLSAYSALRLARERSIVLTDARRTQRIERFMLNLFDGGDPTAGPAGSLRAASLIDRGVQSARTLAGEPAMQADLYQTLGNMYQKLGRLNDADALLQSASAQRKKMNGADSAEEADALVALGLLRIDQARLPEADQFVREGLAMSKRHRSTDDPATLRAMSALGRVVEERGKYDDAVKLLTETVTLQAAQSSASADLSTSIVVMANAHYYLGHFAVAEQLNQRALTMDRQLYGDVHPRVADDLVNLGEIQHDLGHEKRAEQYYRQALDTKWSWYGKDHPETALAMAALGQALIFQGRNDEATGLLHEALAIQERFFGKVHLQVAMGLNTLALLDLNRGHFAEAEAEFRRMADINSTLLGARHYLVGIALINLGELYTKENNYPRAEATLRTALGIFSESLPPGHQNTAIASIKLGHALLLEHRYVEAENYLTNGYESLLKQPNPPPARLAVARTDLAAVYDVLHKPELARSFRDLFAKGH